MIWDFSARAPARRCRPARFEVVANALAVGVADAIIRGVASRNSTVTGRFLHPVPGLGSDRPRDLFIGATPPATGLTDMVISVDASFAAILGALQLPGLSICRPCRVLAVPQAWRHRATSPSTTPIARSPLWASLFSHDLGIPAVLFAVAGGLLGRGDPFPHFMHELQDKWPTLPTGCPGSDRRSPCGQNGHSAPHLDVARLDVARLDVSCRVAATRGGPRAFVNLLVRPGWRTSRPFSPQPLGFGDGRSALDDMRHLLRAGTFELGAHSLTHRAFVHLDNETTEREIVKSTAVVADLVGKSPASIGFAYPYGFVTAHAASVVARHCAAVFTCHERPLSPVDRSPMLLFVDLLRRALAIVVGRVGRFWNRCARRRCSTREPISGDG